MEENSTGFSASPPPPPALPPTPPPLVAPPSLQARRNRGRGWIVVVVILMILLGLSVLFNLTYFLGGLFTPSVGPRYMRVVGPRMDEVLVEEGASSAKIAIIEVEGIISSDMFQQGGFGMVEIIKAQFKRAAEDHRVRGVILKVNSPGGEVLASDEISRAIADFQEKSSKPVIAAMGDLAASGGYYISAPCRWIVANELTLTGSIGVIMSSWNYRGLMDKVGVRPMVYKSGKFKDMMSGSREPGEITEEEREMLRGLIMQTYTKFKDVVSTGREKASELNGDQGRTLAPDWADYADGRVLSGKDAYKFGFVDELGDFEVAVKRAKTLARANAASLIKYQQRYDLSDVLRIFGKSDPSKGTIKLDIGLEAPKLRAGQLYFLAPTAIQ